MRSNSKSKELIKLSIKYTIKIEKTKVLKLFFIKVITEQTSYFTKINII